MTHRIAKAASVIGAVVISAAIILSGTFAAMIPSGITTLIQVALAVIIGLILLVFLLPLVMSSVISLTDKQMNKKIIRKAPAHMTTMIMRYQKALKHQRQMAQTQAIQQHRRNRARHRNRVFI